MASKTPYRVIRRSSVFAEIKRRGQRHRVRPWLLLSALRQSEKELSCGWTLSRRVANSVVRNRLKRWCREYFRLRAPSWAGWMVNVVFLPTAPGVIRSLGRDEIFAALDQAFARLEHRPRVPTEGARS